MNKEEFLAKLKELSSADDILALAKENGIEMTTEKAKELFDKLNGGELTDEQLDSVAGGYWLGGGGRRPYRSVPYSRLSTAAPKGDNKKWLNRLL